MPLLYRFKPFETEWPNLSLFNESLISIHLVYLIPYEQFVLSVKVLCGSANCCRILKSKKSIPKNRMHIVINVANMLKSKKNWNVRNRVQTIRWFFNKYVIQKGGLFQTARDTNQYIDQYIYIANINIGFCQGISIL